MINEGLRREDGNGAARIESLCEGFLSRVWVIRPKEKTMGDEDQLRQLSGG